MTAMDNSFRQTLTTDDRLTLGKLRSDTPGPKTYYRAYHRNHNTTGNDATNDAFMHSGFSRKPRLPPLPDKSPRPRAHSATTEVQTKLSTTALAATTWDRASKNSTPGYIGPGQTSARASPRETAEAIAAPEPTMADLAFFVAGTYPRHAAASSDCDSGVSLTPQLVSLNAQQQKRRQGSGDARMEPSNGEEEVGGVRIPLTRDEAEVRDFESEVRKRNEAVQHFGTGGWSEMRSPDFIERWLNQIPKLNS